MNRNTIIFVAGFAFLFISILLPLSMGEIGRGADMVAAERASRYPPEPMWEVVFILACSIIGISLITIASLKDEKEVSA